QEISSLEPSANDSLKKTKTLQNQLPNLRISNDDSYWNKYENLNINTTSGVNQTTEKLPNIVFHLVKQLKSGTDLSKITLPAFILEKQSLLELFSEILLPLELLVEAALDDDPKLRLLRLGSLFVNGLAYSRQSMLPKKPYNPILGEFFKCKFNVNLNKIKNKENFNKFGLNDSDTLVFDFVAEQVSHHPPSNIISELEFFNTFDILCLNDHRTFLNPFISAFYCENKILGISVSGSLYTKSRFLGVSIACDFVGKTILSFDSIDDTYTVSLPSAYGNGIFSNPWLEMAGKCIITSMKTGHTGTIEFKPSKFLIRGRNEVTCKFFEPNSEFPYSELAGRWTEKIEFVDKEVIIIRFN
ncbi:MAG: Oxysterol-binding protein OBPa, partial [Paramarteilia canceri]